MQESESEIVEPYVKVWKMQSVAVEHRCSASAQSCVESSLKVLTEGRLQLKAILVANNGKNLSQELK